MTPDVGFPHVPFWHVSPLVQSLPSSQGMELSGITVQDDVPLQARVLHWSDAHVMEAPTHTPLPLHVSLYVQASPSLQLAPVRGVTVQVDVPLQALVLHWSDVHVIDVPAQTPLALHVSL